MCVYVCVCVLDHLECLSRGGWLEGGREGGWVGSGLVVGVKGDLGRAHEECECGLVCVCCGSGWGVCWGRGWELMGGVGRVVCVGVGEG
jgi:hypothetical protein